MPSNGDMEDKIKQTNKKVKQLSKKLKYKSLNRKERSISSRKNSLQKYNLKKTTKNILKSNRSLNFLEDNPQKLQNLMINLKHELKIKGNCLVKEKKLREKLQCENKIIQSKLTQLTKSKHKEVNKLRKKLEKNQKKPSVLSSNSKYSRNNKGSVNFSIFTHSYKTESNHSNKGLDMSQRLEAEKTFKGSESKELDDSTVCQKCKVQDLMKEQLEYDPQILIE